MTGDEHGAAGEPFGPYRVLERIGVGGMATVHRAVERGIAGFERVVALKRLLPHLAEDAAFVDAFVREARLAAQLSHASIAQIYELGRVGHTYFISMEYVRGRDLRELLAHARRRAAPPPLPIVVALLLELLDALDYAHALRDAAGRPLELVHRDVSPANLLVAGTGHLKVIDFGIAAAASDRAESHAGLRGKLAYMAPEAIECRPVDRRSDVFAASVVAHELLTARPLFAGGDDLQTIRRVLELDVPPPSELRPGCPVELDALVMAGLARDPAERWDTAGAMRRALEDMAAERGWLVTSREVALWAAAPGDDSLDSVIEITWDEADDDDEPTRVERPSGPFARRPRASTAPPASLAVPVVVPPPRPGRGRTATLPPIPTVTFRPRRPGSAGG
jgi:eukaryotic-like serine/threonine-protein kinase